MKPFPILLCLMSFLGCKAADFRSVDADTFAQVIEDTTVVRLDVRLRTNMHKDISLALCSLMSHKPTLCRKPNNCFLKIKPSPSTAVQEEEARLPLSISLNTATK